MRVCQTLQPEAITQYVGSHPGAVWAVGPFFAAVTGVAFKEGVCYGKPECAALFFMTPALLLGERPHPTPLCACSCAAGSARPACTAVCMQVHVHLCLCLESEGTHNHTCSCGFCMSRLRGSLHAGVL